MAISAWIYFWLSTMLHWCICLFAHQYHTVLTNIACSKIRSHKCPALFSFLKIVLAIWGILWFDTYFKILVLPCEKFLWYFYIESIDWLGLYSHFNNFNLFDQWVWFIFPFICVFFQSFNNILKHSEYKSFTSLVKFTPRCFIFLMWMKIF